jgi:uncharacterized protein YpmB
VKIRLTIGAAAVILVVALGITYHLCSHIIGERRAFENQVREWTQNRTSIVQIDEIMEYRGKQSYAVVLGKNAVGTPVVAWMTADTLVFDTMDRAVSKQSVITAAQQGFPRARILHAVPGLDNGQRFWEVTLLDSDGRYHYVHYDFMTGSVLKSYAIQAIAQS